MTEIRVKRLGVVDKCVFPKHIRYSALKKWQELMTEEAKIILKSFFWGGAVKAFTNTKDDAQNPF